MTRTRRIANRKPRGGFTLIELLVVISIIAVLASLIAPAVQSARRAARKLECLNNIRNCGLAIQNFSSGQGGLLPYLQTSLNTNTSGVSMPAAWTISILPALDAGALLRNIKANGTAAGPGPLEKIWVQAFTCPDDTDSFRQPGGLSYVANAGFISNAVWGLNNETFNAGGTYHQLYLLDWNNIHGSSTDGTSSGGTPNQGDSHIAAATGVFWRPDAVNNYQSSMDYISTGDGATTTIMLAENLQAGPWWGYYTDQIGFGLMVNQGGSVPSAPFSPGNNALVLNTIAGGGVQASYASTPFAINNAAAGYNSHSLGIPRPSSQHIGGVNVVMCDGSSRFINENINLDVYAKLLTSNGVTYGETTLNNNSY
jgi:prepilin-type N-terminal cleavage/methylation domain-containing protein/prepilin-type processing-associated H-X9-DG protein